MNSVVKAMAETGMVVSCSQARRAIAMGAVKINGKTIDDIMAEVKAGDTVQLGKREAIRIGEEPDSKSGAGKTVASSNLAASAQQGDKP